VNKLIIGTIALLIICQADMFSQVVHLDSPIRSTQTTETPQIDGDLKDELWNRPADID
jgi:hypothetical protein